MMEEGAGAMRSASGGGTPLRPRGPTGGSGCRSGSRRSLGMASPFNAPPPSPPPRSPRPLPAPPAVAVAERLRADVGGGPAAAVVPGAPRARVR